MNAIPLRERISPEYNLIKTADTMGGSLTHLGGLFSKIQTFPDVNRIIAQAEAELAEEDHFAFENLEKAVAWFHDKINILLPHVEWKPNSFEIAQVNSLLNFKTISLSPGGYIGSLQMELRRLFIEVARKEKNHPSFEGWTCIDTDTIQRIFDCPDYVGRTLNSIPMEQQIYQWKEKADTHLPCLLRFLKILTLYNTYQPLVLEPRPDLNTLPKNLRELEERQCQAHIGFYLSCFKSHDSKEHPLSKNELISLLDRFLYMVEQKMEAYSSKTSADCSTQININVIINQFLFFSANTHSAEAKKKDCSDNLENNQSNQTSPKSGEKISSKPKTKHWRTEQCNQDINTLTPYAKKIWIKYLTNCEFPMKLGRKKLAEELLRILPNHISLHSKNTNRFSRAVKAIKRTDPRICENGEFKGLKPHWQEFNWVKI